MKAVIIAETDVDRRTAAIELATDADVFVFFGPHSRPATPDSLKKLASVFRTSPRVGLAYCDCQADNNPHNGLRLYREPFNYERFRENDIVGEDFVVTRAAIEFAAPVDGRAFIGRLMGKFMAIHVPEPLICVSPGSSSWQSHWSVAYGKILEGN